jgi:Ser/Thr protein kinase RdoA (MazF antagonist)
VADTKELKAIKEASERFLEKLRNDPIALKKWLREIQGPEQRIIEGREKEHLFTVFNLIEPTSESNNQRTWTTVYHHAGKEYHYTVGEGFDELAEILPDDI